MNKKAIKLKPKKILCLVMLLAVLTLYIGYAYEGWRFTGSKIIDIHDARFDEKKFRFEDYSEREIEGVINGLVKPGMSMTEIDAILYDAGGADKVFLSRVGNVNQFMYFYRPWPKRIRVISFDPQIGYEVQVNYNANDIAVEVLFRLAEFFPLNGNYKHRGYFQ